MAALVALLRAVNVGGTGKLPMEALREMIAQAGGTDVATYIASGNAVFCHDGPPEKIRDRLETALQAHAGKPVGTVIRTVGQLDTVLADLPFPTAAPNRLALLFTDAPIPTDPAAEARHRADEQIHPGEGVIYIHYPSGMGPSKLGLPAMKTGTARNLNTVRKLHQMLIDRQAR